LGGKRNIIVELGKKKKYGVVGDIVRRNRSKKKGG